VTTDREITLSRGANNQWTPAGKESLPANQTNVQSLLNTLSTLHAVRWLGTNAPPNVFDKPQVVVTFTTSPDDKAVHKLTVGNSDNQGMWFGKVDEREGVFVINTPDYNALKLPLLQPPATPSPSPAASGSPSVPPVATASPK
jgi:hypothetical protein